MNTYKIIKVLEDIASVLVILAVIFLIVAISFGLAKYIAERETTSPVEEITLVDSIKQENNKLVIEINNLDSIKNVKAIEIKSLTNDSTLSLFYQLISK